MNLFNLLLKNIFKKYILFIFFWIICYFLLLIFYSLNNNFVVNKYIISNNLQKNKLIKINTSDFMLIKSTVIEESFFKKIIFEESKIMIEKNNSDYFLSVLNYYDNCSNLDDSYIYKYYDDEKNFYTINLLEKNNNYIKNKLFFCKKNITFKINNVIKENEKIYILINGKITSFLTPGDEND